MPAPQPLTPESDAATPGPSQVATEVPRAWRTAALALAALLLVALGVGTYAVRTSTWTPAEGSVEVGFARDMTAHHQQAVVMSFLVRDLTDDEQVRALSLDLVTGQSEEMGMLTAWLRRHDVPAASTVPPMAWMEGGDHDMTGMAGMTGASDGAATWESMGIATDEQLAHLATLSGRQAEVEFLTLMRRHHVGGTEMIQAYLDRGTDGELVGIAEGMRTAQDREIRVIDQLLAQRTA